jgi:hypothetical protein
MDLSNLVVSITYPLPVLRQPINTSSCDHLSNLNGVQDYLIYMDSNFNLSAIKRLKYPMWIACVC